MKAPVKINLQAAMLKAHGNVSIVTSTSIWRLNDGRVLVNFSDDDGNPLAGGLIISSSDLTKIATAASRTRREKVNVNVKEVIIKRTV